MLGLFGGQLRVIVAGQNLFQFDVVADAGAGQVGFLAGFSNRLGTR
jgi:hypothetical protein